MQTRHQSRQVECAVCFERITLRGKLDRCTHLFCAACISRWAQVVPPNLDRKPLSSVQTTVRVHLPSGLASPLQLSSTTPHVLPSKLSGEERVPQRNQFDSILPHEIFYSELQSG
jgi:hypothetical protein